MKFTTSWDDGYRDDLRVAQLLDVHGMTGTFYVCPVPQHEQTMLTKEETKHVSDRHEIGAHSMTHPKLSKIPLEQAREEIGGSKAWIESVTGKPCTMFCYPYGDYNPDIASLVREEGFRGARSTETYAFDGNDPFALPGTLHVYPFPLRPVLNRKAFQPISRAQKTLRKIGVPVLAMRGWLPLAKSLFEIAHERQAPWFHLWGHSAEVTRYGMWELLEAFLKCVQTFPGVEYVQNSALVPARHTK
ncbi:MAG: polysaccharide deacetylase family protein [Patescibacteria group bacterium]